MLRSQDRGQDVWITLYRGNAQFARQKRCETLDDRMQCDLAGQHAAAGDCMRILVTERNWISTLYMSYKHLHDGTVCPRYQRQSNVTAFVEQMEQCSGRYTRQQLRNISRRLLNSPQSYGWTTWATAHARGETIADFQNNIGSMAKRRYTNEPFMGPRELQANRRRCQT